MSSFLNRCFALRTPARAAVVVAALVLRAALPGFAAADPAAELPPLRSAAAVRALSVEEAARQLPVRLSGVVTYFERWASLCFVQDDSAGIYVAADRALRNLQAGDAVEVVGTTAPGSFAPSIIGPGQHTLIRSNYVQLRLLGTTSLPVPLKLAGADLNSPAHDCQWVQVRGIIKQVSAQKTPLGDRHRALLRLEVDGERVSVIVPDFASPTDLPVQLIGATAQVTGVYGTVSNERRQLTDRMLYVQNLAQVVVLAAGLTPTEELPLTAATNLLQFAGGQVSQRVRVRGEVLWRDPWRQDLYLRADGVGLLAQSAQVGNVRPGEIVEAVGYATPAAIKPFLRDAVFHVVGTNPPPLPRVLPPGEFLLDDQHADLLTAEVELLLRQAGPEEVVLGLRHGANLMEARLPARAAVELPEMPPGSLLRITGIARAERASGASRGQGKLILLPRTAGDVVVLVRPPWLTLRRAVLLAGGLAVVCGLAGLWILLLRRRVEHQTGIIRRHVTQAAVEEERARIARDFHDTVQQQLAGIGMQLETAELSLRDDPALAGQSLTLGRQMIRHSLAETRQVIWELRSPALEQGGLVAALQELVASRQQGCATRIALEVAGAARRLAPAVEQGLLRIAHEALNNAIKHAAASRCRVTLTFAADAVTLQVQDDGRGLAAPEARQASTDLHFGLLGMQERANKLGGTLRLDSQPAAGTTVTVRLPQPLTPP